MNKVILLACLIAIISATQYVPIQSTYDGIHVGEHSAKLHIEAFYDLLCSDCKANHPIFSKVVQEADLTKVQFTYHIFPLPYHIEAFTGAIGLRFFVNRFDTTATLAYVDYVFQIQDQYLGPATDNLTQNQVISNFATQVAGHFQQEYPQYKFSQQDFVNALKNPSYDIQSRSSWKYGCSRGVSGTPAFFVNGVLLDNAESYGLEEWQGFIEAQTMFSLMQEELVTFNNFLP